MVEQHGIIGDDFGTELPQMQPDQTALDEDKQMAQYAKSEEFQRIRDHFNRKIAFYQTFLPDGRALTEVNKQERDDMWLVANIVIAELKLILAEYDNVRESVDGRETS